MKLDQLEIGKSAFVSKVLDAELALVLAEQGILPNQKVEVRFRAPLGGPIVISLDSHMVSLRKSEAENIEISI